MPDPFGGLDPKGIFDTTGRLASGDYHLCVTYGDLGGKETGKSYTYDVHVDTSQNAIEVGLPSIPAGAHQIVVYLRQDQDSSENLSERAFVLKFCLKNVLRGVIKAA